ncbi:MAG: Subtilisin-like protease [Actinomycetia bacterium]|nr:Subtilisin-like protease [Actinomycetes bacterium]
MRRTLVVLGVVCAVAFGTLVPPAGAQDDATESPARNYLVLYADGASNAAGRDAVAASGGTLTSENTKIGLAEVTSTNPDFLQEVRATSSVKGAAADRSIGTTRPGMGHKFSDERLQGERARRRPPGGHGGGASKGAEPLADHQWDMKMIGTQAPDGRAALAERGKGVLVGVIDTGIDGRHPDVAPNFSSRLSRNFTVDIPSLDGPCEHAGCVDPADEDDDGHGTHVAGTIAAPLNATGISGVAPEATLVNIRAGQDSGYFFLGPTVDALTYAADAGIDVVNMSFYVDPWLYNCPSAGDYVDAPAGKPTAEELAEQRTIYDAMHEALAVAHDAGVTMVAAAGNGATDLDTPTRFDDSSPDFPVDENLEPTESYARTVTDHCLDLPSEGPNVLSISSVGPSGIKADYSNYGTSEITVAAPGGYFRDHFGTDQYGSPANLIWAPYPQNVALANGDITEPGGTPTNDFVVQSCARAGCAYYQGIQGTSMASPHVTGVAALVIGALGRRANPDLVRAILEQSAADHACPTPPTVDYTIVGRPASWNATCTGTPTHNNFYGHGLVDARAAVALASGRHR